MNGRKQAVGQLSFTLLLLAIVAGAFAMSRAWPFGARLFPFWVSGATALLLVLIVLRQLPGLLATRDDSMATLDEAATVTARRESRLVLRTAAVIAGFAVAIYLLGFLIGGPLAVLLYVRYVGRESWVSALLLSAGSAVAVLLFQEVLRVPFPRPVIPFLVGLLPLLR